MNWQIVKLKMPVRIEITVVQGDGSATTEVLIPGGNLTEDGVRFNLDRDHQELCKGIVTTYTRRSIEWTEVEYE